MPAHTAAPTLANRAKRSRHERADGANRIAASSPSGGASSEPAAPDDPELTRERLRFEIARPRERKHLAILSHSHLRERCARSPKPVEPDARCVRPPRDTRDSQSKPGAQQRRASTSEY